MSGASPAYVEIGVAMTIRSAPSTPEREIVGDCVRQGQFGDDGARLGAGIDGDDVPDQPRAAWPRARSTNRYAETDDRDAVEENGAHFFRNVAIVSVTIRISSSWPMVTRNPSGKP